MATYKPYLKHMNPNHDPKNGQFTFAKGANLGAGIGKNFKSTTNEVSQVVDRYGKTKKNPRADLSKLSDQELRDLLNREEMERRYDTYFNTPTEKKGAKYTKDVLAIAGAVGGVLVAGLTAAGLVVELVKGINSIRDKNKDTKNMKPWADAIKRNNNDMNFFS